MEVILRLFTETEPITVESDWFTLRNARAAAAALHAAAHADRGGGGAVALGHGDGRTVRRRRAQPGAAANAEATLADFWQIAEKTAAQYGQTMDRNEWRLVLHVHLAETREQAIEEARARAGDYRHDYFETTLGQPATSTCRTARSSTTWPTTRLVHRHAGRPDRGDPQGARELAAASAGC